MPSRSQIDRLGDHLRSGAATATTLRELERYRADFASAYAHVEFVLTNTLRLHVTGRPSKSAVSIVEKLRRESIRLSQIQDIAGCRVIVADIEAQDTVCLAIEAFLRAKVFDRRIHSSHGYRAVHLVARYNNVPIEIQVRTSLQHAWAELSEKISDSYGQEIKYGGGEQWAQNFLRALAEKVERLEGLKERMKSARARVEAEHRSSATRRDLKRGEERLLRQASETIAEIQKLFKGISDR